MGEFLKNINWKHVLIMCIGNVFAGMGIGIFKLAGLGTDPFSGLLTEMQTALQELLQEALSVPISSSVRPP